MLIESDTYGLCSSTGLPHVDRLLGAALLWGVHLRLISGSTRGGRPDPVARLSQTARAGGAGVVVELLGGISGFYVASYTGVLLGVTNRPIWSDTPLLGMLFVVSAASTSAALMTLLGHRSAVTLPGMADLHRLETWVIVLELLVFIAVVASLGRVLSAWLNGWGVLLLIVVALGMVAPLYLAWRRNPIRAGSISTSAILVLIAGLLLRVVIVFSSERVV